MPEQLNAVRLANCDECSFQIDAFQSGPTQGAYPTPAYRFVLVKVDNLEWLPEWSLAYLRANHAANHPASLVSCCSYAVFDLFSLRIALRESRNDCLNLYSNLTGGTPGTLSDSREIFLPQWIPLNAFRTGTLNFGSISNRFIIVPYYRMGFSVHGMGILDRGTRTLTQFSQTNYPDLCSYTHRHFWYSPLTNTVMLTNEQAHNRDHHHYRNLRLPTHTPGLFDTTNDYNLNITSCILSVSDILHDSSRTQWVGRPINPVTPSAATTGSTVTSRTQRVTVGETVSTAQNPVSTAQNPLKPDLFDI